MESGHPFRERAADFRVRSFLPRPSLPQTESCPIPVTASLLRVGVRFGVRVAGVAGVRVERLIRVRCVASAGQLRCFCQLWGGVVCCWASVGEGWKRWEGHTPCAWACGLLAYAARGSQAPIWGTMMLASSTPTKTPAVFAATGGRSTFCGDPEVRAVPQKGPPLPSGLQAVLQPCGSLHCTTIGGPPARGAALCFPDARQGNPVGLWG